MRVSPDPENDSLGEHEPVLDSDKPAPLFRYSYPLEQCYACRHCGLLYFEETKEPAP